MRFAIVDDNIEEIHMTELLIRDWCGIHNITVCCDTFTEGDAFLLSAASNSYDFVLFDIYLKKANGIDLAVSFRKIFTEDTDCLSDLQPGISCGSFACPRFRLSAKADYAGTIAQPSEVGD